MIHYGIIKWGGWEMNTQTINVVFNMIGILKEKLNNFIIRASKFYKNFFL